MVPKTTQVQWFLRRTHRTHHLLILTALIYYSKKEIKQIRKGKRHTGAFWRKLGTNFKESSPIGLPSNEFWWHIWNAVYQEGSLETQHLSFSLDSGDIELSTECAQNFQTSKKKEERKKVFNINHIVCINSFGTVSLSLQGIVETFSKSKFLDASQGPALQTGLRIDSSCKPATLTFSSTDSQIV